MPTQQFPVSLFVNVSISSTPVGVSAYNTSNLAIFTTETPSPTFTNGYKIYFDPSDVATDFGTDSVTFSMATKAFSQVPNFTVPGGYLVVIPFEPSETLVAAVARTSNLVQYFGFMSTQIESQVDMLAAADLIASANKIMYTVYVDPATVAPGGTIDLIRQGSLDQTRGLLRVDNTDNALDYMAAYAGRTISTVFSGSDTAQNINLQSLVGILPDPGMTPTILTNAATAGADVYISVAGSFSAVKASGANKFFDQVYNGQWLSGALQVAGINFLRGTTTKVPQTEGGMNGLKAALRTVMIQAVTNGYLAPGTWNSPTTFGNQADLIANVAQYGFYIYSSPIALQLQADRVARVAPLIQIAAKESGAIDSATIIISINP